MNCEGLRRSIFGYVEQQLSAAARAEFEAHRGACSCCADLVRDVLALPCREFVQFLDDYCDDRLPAEQRAVFERHMQLCPPCVDYLDSYKLTIRIGRISCAEAPEVPEKLIQAILRARQAGS
jgi:anti-sigma factor RsiW